MKKIVINNLSGHKLPSNKSFSIVVTLDFEDMDADEMAVCMLNASSPKVKVNSRLGTWSVARLEALNGKYEVKVRDLYTRAERTYRPPTVGEARDTLLSQPLEAFIRMVVEELGGTEDNAVKIYAKKHSKTIEEVVAMRKAVIDAVKE